MSPKNKTIIVENPNRDSRLRESKCCMWWN